MTQNRYIHCRPYLFRFCVGTAIAAASYYFVSISSLQDCSTLRLTVHNGGILALGRIALALFAATLIGIPTPIAAVCAGILTNPMTGSALTSFAFITALAVSFGFGRIVGRNHPLVRRFERWASGRLWFSDLMAARAQSGLHWASEFIYRTPIPPTLLAAFCGASIKHLQLVELLAGGFLSVIAVIVAYSLAGGTIGCALLDYTHGFPTEDYILPIILSALALIIVSKLRPRISL